MKNLQKGSANIWLIVVVLILLIIVGYFAFMKKPMTEEQSTITPVVQNSVPISTIESSVKPTTSEKVRVITPNGGETYKLGNDLTIKWWDDNDAGNRNILITDLTHNSPGAEFMIQYDQFVRSSGIDGTYAKLWKISNIPAGKYVIQVCKSGTDDCDLSDNYFTVTSQ